MNSQQYRIGDSKVLESREVSDGKTIRRRAKRLMVNIVLQPMSALKSLTWLL